MFNTNSQVTVVSYMYCYIAITQLDIKGNNILIASVGKPCNQSESPPPRSQLHSQGYFTIAETAEDGQTAGCSRRNVIRGNNNITKEVGLIIKYVGHKLIIRIQQYNIMYLITQN